MPGAPSDREMTKGAFDGAAFWSALNNKAHERDMNMREISTVTGVLPATLSRLRKNKCAPDVPNFLALCQWGGFDPIDFWRSTVERTRIAVSTQAVDLGDNILSVAADAKIIGFGDTPDNYYVRILQRVDVNEKPINPMQREVLVVQDGFIHGRVLDELRAIPGWATSPPPLSPVSAFEVIKI